MAPTHSPTFMAPPLPRAGGCRHRARLHLGRPTGRPREVWSRPGAGAPLASSPDTRSSGARPAGTRSIR